MLNFSARNLCAPHACKLCLRHAGHTCCTVQLLAIHLILSFVVRYCWATGSPNELRSSMPSWPQPPAGSLIPPDIISTYMPSSLFWSTSNLILSHSSTATATQQMLNHQRQLRVAHHNFTMNTTYSVSTYAELVACANLLSSLGADAPASVTIQLAVPTMVVDSTLGAVFRAESQSVTVIGDVGGTVLTCDNQTLSKTSAGVVILLLSQGHHYFERVTFANCRRVGKS